MALFYVASVPLRMVYMSLKEKACIKRCAGAAIKFSSLRKMYEYHMCRLHLMQLHKGSCVVLFALDFISMSPTKVA